MQPARRRILTDDFGDRTGGSGFEVYDQNLRVVVLRLQGGNQKRHFIHRQGYRMGQDDQ